ncbi:hypothetical protein PT974_00123 [Cladobotryum mycophilum]|uniref:Helicase-associated domain-containing protein n=1 Tax=Cladobotryum mycophilum TaxID=491253 RepID=A0ABR0T076_9HYPO
MAEEEIGEYVRKVLQEMQVLAGKILAPWEQRKIYVQPMTKKVALRVAMMLDVITSGELVAEDTKDLDSDSETDGFFDEATILQYLSGLHKAIFKGLILAEPPELGKTLPALMVIAATLGPGIEPSAIVMASLCTLDKPALPAELGKHKLYLTSHNYVSSEIGRAWKFAKNIDLYRRAAGSGLPNRLVQDKGLGQYRSDEYEKDLRSYHQIR